MNPSRKDTVKPAGPTAPEVSIVSVETAKGKPLAVWGNHPLHYVGAVPETQVQLTLGSNP